MSNSIFRDLGNLKIKYVDNNYIFVPAILLLFIEIVLLYSLDIRFAILGGLPLLLLTILAIQFHLYRKTEGDLEEERRQIQALISIHQMIKVRAPLPPLTGWSASPELACAIIDCIGIVEPSFILEAGSGVSTLTSSYYLERMGNGKLKSLDHDKNYAAKTQRLLMRHGLTSYGSVAYAPLKEYDIDGKNWWWYDLGTLQSDEIIDILIIDGPPVKTQPNARYPALPLLRQYLSEKAVVILDDAGRESESELLRIWLNDYPEFELELKNTQKQIAILHRT